MAPACWLWDYLRCAGLRYLFLIHRNKLPKYIIRSKILVYISCLYYLMILYVYMYILDDLAKVDFSYHWAAASTRRLQRVSYIRCVKWSSNRSVEEVRLGYAIPSQTTGVSFKFRKLYFVFRHTGLSGYQEDCRRLRIRTSRSEAIVQHHLGHVLYGNGELIGGDQGPSGRVGQSNRVLSSRDSHRYCDIRNFRDLPTGY